MGDIDFVPMRARFNPTPGPSRRSVSTRPKALGRGDSSLKTDAKAAALTASVAAEIVVLGHKVVDDAVDFGQMARLWDFFGNRKCFFRRKAFGILVWALVSCTWS